jgi:hypothetical protein
MAYQSPLQEVALGARIRSCLSSKIESCRIEQGLSAGHAGRIYRLGKFAKLGEERQ